jgi:hypothetical protein
MRDRFRRHARLLGLTAPAALMLACGPFDPGLLDGGSQVSGSVHDSEFVVESGSAEDDTMGGFVITLADTPEFSCSSVGGLPETYLTIVLGPIDGPAEFPASSTVVFNAFEDGVGFAQPASSGSLMIDEIDTTFGTIRGSVDASGPDSSVSGSFSVDICF